MGEIWDFEKITQIYVHASYKKQGIKAHFFVSQVSSLPNANSSSGQVVEASHT
jgi:hypothetical protein